MHTSLTSELTHEADKSKLTSANYSLEPVIVIDSGLRKITIPENLKIIGVTGDQNAETLQFQIPRYFDGRDLSTHDIVIRYINANGEYGEYSVTDKSSDDDCVTFSWIISNYVTRYAGDVSFSVQFETSTDDDGITYQWQTTPATLTVLAGIDTSTVITSKDDTIFRKMTKMMESLETQMNLLTTKVNNYGISKSDFGSVRNRVTYLENNVVYSDLDEESEV